MPNRGWQRLVAGTGFFQQGPGPGRYPIAAYSEFMPPPRLGRKPYGGLDRRLFDPADPWGWRVTEYEEALVRPGLAHCSPGTAARAAAPGPRRAGTRHRPQEARSNPYWPPTWHDRAAPRRTSDTCSCCRWPCANPGRQGPRALDAVRRQRAGPGAGLLARASSPRPSDELPARAADWNSSAGCWPPPMAKRPTSRPSCAAPASASTPARKPPCCPSGTRSRCPPGRRPIAGSKGSRSAACATC